MEARTRVRRGSWPLPAYIQLGFLVLRDVYKIKPENARNGQGPPTFSLLLFLYFLAVLGLRCGKQSLRLLCASSLQWVVLLQSAGTRAGGLSGGGAWAYLSWGGWNLSSPTRGRTCVSCIGRQTLHPWTTREVPI